jgi:hypothetical protein
MVTVDVHTDLVKRSAAKMASSIRRVEASKAEDALHVFGFLWPKALIGVLDAQSHRAECLHQLVSGPSSVAAAISDEVRRNLWFLILGTSQLHADR